MTPTCPHVTAQVSTQQERTGHTDVVTEVEMGMQRRQGNAARFRATGGSSVAPARDERSWVLRATSAEAPARHGVEKCLQGWGTVRQTEELAPAASALS